MKQYEDELARKRLQYEHELNRQVRRRRSGGWGNPWARCGRAGVGRGSAAAVVQCSFVRAGGRNAALARPPLLAWRHATGVRHTQFRSCRVQRQAELIKLQEDTETNLFLSYSFPSCCLQRQAELIKLQEDSAAKQEAERLRVEQQIQAERKAAEAYAAEMQKEIARECAPGLAWGR